MSFWASFKWTTWNLNSRNTGKCEMATITVRQVMESEKKLELVCILHLISAKCEEFSLLHFLADCDDEKHDNLPTDSNDTDLLTVLDESCDVEIEDRDFSSFVFIAGYIVYKIAKKLSCNLCMLELCSYESMVFEASDNVSHQFAYIEDLDRGGLIWPTQYTTDIIMKVYAVFQCLISPLHEEKFLAVRSHQQIFMTLGTEFVGVTNKICECGMGSTEIVKKCVLTASNIMLTNYIKIINEKKAVAKTMKAKRKLSTLTGK